MTLVSDVFHFYQSGIFIKYLDVKLSNEDLRKFKVFVQKTRYKSNESVTKVWRNQRGLETWHFLLSY